MNEQLEYAELRDEIQRLRDEQQRLRDEQEQLRREKANPSSNKENQNNGDSHGPSDKKEDGQNKDQADQGDKNNEDTESKKQKQNGGDEKQKQEEQQPKPPVMTRVRTFVATHRKQVLIGSIIFVALVIATVFLVIYLDSYESTDDAQVDGHLNAITSRIKCTVTQVYVEDNQQVTAGQLLVELDPRDYQVALDQANANYAQAVAQLNAENPNIPIVRTSNETQIYSANTDVASAQAGLEAAEQNYEAKQANVRQADANNTKAQNDVQRYQLLVAKDEISHQQFDTAVAAAKSEADGVAAAQDAARAAQKAVDQSHSQLQRANSLLEESRQNAPRTEAIRRSQLSMRDAMVKAAQAQLEQAKLNVSYGKILAPVGGIIGEKRVEVGQSIEAGEQLFVIGQLDDIWITANFKETQLKRMRPGQAVDIQVDAYGTKYRGYVENMPGETGAVTSLLPPENATGNYVKVVQRLPVRIRLNPGQDPDHRLRIGMSVEPKVWPNTGR